MIISAPLMSLTPKCDMFLEIPLSRLDRKCRKLFKCQNSRKSRVSKKVRTSRKTRKSRDNKKSRESM